MTPGYESFFGLFERPFSLTPDPRYHFRSRAHARALGSLSTGLSRHAPLLLLTGDLGTGKSTLCRTIVRAHQRATQVVHVANALLSPEELYRRLVCDLGAVPSSEAGRRRLPEAGIEELERWLVARLRQPGRAAPLVLIDEAHLLPLSTVHRLLGLLSFESADRPLAQVLLAAQPPSVGAPTLPRAVEASVPHRAHLTPLDPDECEAYIQHRLRVAGGAPIVVDPRAIDVLFAVSNGVPRLVNLLCDRALHEAASLGLRRLEPAMLDAAAATLELLRSRPRRVRGFGAPPAAASV